MLARERVGQGRTKRPIQNRLCWISTGMSWEIVYGGTPPPHPATHNQRPNSWAKSRQVFRVFPLATQSHLYSFALRFLFLQTQLNLFQFLQCVVLYNVRENGGKPDRKPHPLPMV
jgi:hypothetical protein